MKPQNILITELGQFKVCDFGVAHFLGDKKYLRLPDKIGTDYFMSPELFLDGDLNIRFSTDIWGLGVIAYLMCSLCTVPYEHSRHIVDDGIYTKLFHKAQYSPDLQNLIFAMLHRDPKIRPTADAILKHRCLKEVVDVDRQKLFGANFVKEIVKKPAMPVIKTGDKQKFPEKPLYTKTQT